MRFVAVQDDKLQCYVFSLNAFRSLQATSINRLDSLT